MAKNVFGELLRDVFGPIDILNSNAPPRVAKIFGEEQYALPFA